MDMIDISSSARCYCHTLNACATSDDDLGYIANDTGDAEVQSTIKRDLHDLEQVVCTPYSVLSDIQEQFSVP